MAEGSRRCGSSRSADKLSLLDASAPKVQPLLQPSSAAHPLASQQPFNNSSPPGNEPCRPPWLVSVVTLPPPSFPFPLFIFSLARNAMAFVFFPDFPNLNNFPLSSPSTQTKPKGACSYSLFLWRFIFYLMTHNYSLGVPSAADLEKWQRAGENAWLTPFYSVYSKVP